MSKNRYIWSSEPSSDMITDILSFMPGYSPEEAFSEGVEICKNKRGLICELLDHITGSFIILGKIYHPSGRSNGFTPLPVNNLGQAFEMLSVPLQCKSSTSIFVSEDSDIIAHKAHSCGVNEYVLRQLDKNYSLAEFEEVAAMTSGQNIWFQMHTRPCGQYIAEVFGWEKESF